jgi:shikimate dehydrogenase
MIKACVIGYPLGYSLSPVIHNGWFEKYGIPGKYESIPILPNDLKTGVEKLKAEGYSGFNVTIPHKQAIMSLCDSVDEAAKMIRAVNMVIVHKDGRLEGRNTDAYGFAHNLQQKLPGFDWKKGPALVLGAGGAARAVVHALKVRGVPDTAIANRSEDKAMELAKGHKARVVSWEKRGEALENIDILVNATALGMTGKPPLDLPLGLLPERAAVYDIVYAPLMTPLLQDAQKRGNRIVTGIGMLLHQAVPAFEAWTGTRPEVDAALERKIMEKIP